MLACPENAHHGHTVPNLPIHRRKTRRIPHLRINHVSILPLPQTRQAGRSGNLSVTMRLMGSGGIARRPIGKRLGRASDWSAWVVGAQLCRRTLCRLW